MEIQIRKHGSYIPKWRGNRELSEKEQIVFHYRYLTNDERSDYIYLQPITLKQVSDDDALNREYVQDGKGIAKTVTTKIDNLIIDADGKKEEIKDIETFYKYSFPLLAAEYETHLLNASQVIESKNSKSPSG